MPVRHCCPGEFLPIALLSGSQFVIEDQDIAMALLHPIRDLLSLARADEVAGMILPVMHQHPIYDGQPQC